MVGFSCVVVVGASVPSPVVVAGADVSVDAAVVGPAASVVEVDVFLDPQAAPKMARAATEETTIATRRRLAWDVVLTLLFPLLD